MRVAVPGPPGTARVSLDRHLCLSVLWFALFAQWLTIVPVILPDQVAAMLGRHGVDEEAVTGEVVAIGAAVALLVTPLAGALSDRLRAARGRRRPFLVSGMLGTCVALACLGLFGSGSSLPLYILVFVNLQFWWNWAAGPYAGLVPDVVPSGAQGMASAWVNVMSIAGSIVGNLLVAFLYPRFGIVPVAGIFVVFSLVGLAATVFGVREPAAPGAPQPFRLAAFLRSFLIDPQANRNFYWVLITRIAANMGVWSIFAFLVFYLENVVGMNAAEATGLLPLLLGGGACLAIPASLVGINMAERHGAIRIVQLTSWVMAISAVGLVLLAPARQIVPVAAVMLVFGVANGAYGAVDWYLALKVLPSGRDAGKDLGIWHICMVLPQMVGPVTVGWIITAIRGVASAALAYEVAFAIAALWFTLAAILVTQIRLPTQPKIGATA